MAAGINVLYKINDILHTNLCCVLNIRYILILRTIIEKDDKIPRIVVFVESEFHLLAVSYNEKYFSFVVNTLKTKAI